MQRGAPRGHGRDMANRQRGGGVVEQDTPHKALHYFSTPPPVGDLAECASPGAQLSQGNSALLFIYPNNKWNEAENEAE